LVRLHLTLDVLKVEQFGNVRVDKDMMAALNSLDSKPQCFCQPDHIAKAHIVRRHEDSLEKSSRSHAVEAYRARFADGFKVLLSRLGSQEPDKRDTTLENARGRTPGLARRPGEATTGPGREKDREYEPQGTPPLAGGCVKREGGHQGGGNAIGLARWVSSSAHPPSDGQGIHEREICVHWK
jgi:hypothetical protein